MNEPVLFIIPGLIDTLTCIEPEARIRSAVVHTCDLLGYGRSRDIPQDRLTLQAQVDHVFEHLGSIGGGNVWVLGHSMGGQIAMMLADQHPDLLSGMINVEGNFTMKDAFWSSKIVGQRVEEWAAEYQSMQDDPAAWLSRCGVETNPRNILWGKHILANQPADTVYSMSAELVAAAKIPDYPAAVRRVVERGPPIHLLAGERSAAAWDVPDFVLRAAASYTQMPGVGHLMMLEMPDEFCRMIDRLIEKELTRG
ncbi:MAG: alpha/beta hydrolase [Phycisphaerales bacterium]|nr:MAG: alpha/beta hydrolase [Phycisphaerales bacterium]